MNTAEAMTAASEAPVAAVQLLSEPASTGLRRLQASDGLFLRAEHLNQIQTYASALVRLSTMAGGAGTVWGYDLHLSAPDVALHRDGSGKDRADADKGGADGPEQVGGDGHGDQDDGATQSHATLTVLPGLAVSSAGRALRSQAPIVVDLSALETGVTGRFWVVEVVPADARPAGNEPAYSAVCATSCGSGSGIQPWADEQVRVRVRAAQIESVWDSEAPAHQRSALASAWFERERRQPNPWLTPITSGEVIPPVSGRAWSSSAPSVEPDEQAVPLGLLLRSEGSWIVDAWAARRDFSETPPLGAWLGRLGMRPWRVFAAQVLQFESQLKGLELDAALTDRFLELPPGGFVDLDSGSLDRESLWSRLSDRFGDVVDIEVHLVTPDEAIRRVTHAQHLDRIPLRESARRRPVVDVWVPSVQPDLEHTQAEYRSWVGFTHGQPYGEGGDDFVAHPDARRATRRAGDTVGVHLVRAAPTRRDRRVNVVETALADKPAVVLQLGQGDWRVSASHKAALSALRRKIGSDAAQKVAYLVISSAQQDHLPLLTARAQALAEALGVPAGARTVHDVPRTDGPDAIVLMVTP
jgi:hypothetical protein